MVVDYTEKPEGGGDTPPDAQVGEKDVLAGGIQKREKRLAENALDVQGIGGRSNKRPGNRRENDGDGGSNRNRQTGGDCGRVIKRNSVVKPIHRRDVSIQVIHLYLQGIVMSFGDAEDSWS
eukprot:jgi/Psemu1/33108/gm1.33108_g